MASGKDLAITVHEQQSEAIQISRKHYRPASTRSWTLCAFLFVVATCFGLLFILDYVKSADSGTTAVKRHVLHERTGISFASAPTATTTIYDDFIPSTTATTTGPGAPPPESQLTLTSQIQPTVTSQNQPTATEISSLISADESGHANGPVSPSTTPTSSQITEAPNPANQLSLTSSYYSTETPITVGAPYGGDQLSLSLALTNGDYFLGLYLPKIIAVAMQAFWSMTYSATKIMEPFYQMSAIDGGDAVNTVLAPYLSTGLTMGNLTSGVITDWVLPLTALVYICLGLLVSLVSEGFAIGPTATCSTPLSPHQPCNPAWIVNKTITEALRGLLALMFIVVFVIVILNRKRTSGVSEDPSSIAAMSEMLVDEDVLRDFRALGANASNTEVSRALAHHKYRLGYFVTSTGQQKYGIHKTGGQSVFSSGYTTVPNPATEGQRSLSVRKSHGDFLHDIAVLILMIALFGIILSYKLIGESDSAFNNFMNSASFGPRFLLSGLAFIINSRLRYIERRVRVMEVYTRMSRSPQPANRSIRLGVSSSPFTSVFSSIGTGYYFAAAVAFVTVLSEFLMITVSGVPFASGQTADSYKVSTWLSLAILGIIIVVVAAVAFVRRQSVPDIPRLPTKLANCMTYLCNSNLINTDTRPTPNQMMSRGEEKGPLISSGAFAPKDDPNTMYAFEKVPDHRGVPVWTVNAVVQHHDYEQSRMLTRLSN